MRCGGGGSGGRGGGGGLRWGGGLCHLREIDEPQLLLVADHEVELVKVAVDEAVLRQPHDHVEELGVNTADVLQLGNLFFVVLEEGVSERSGGRMSSLIVSLVMVEAWFRDGERGGVW